MRLALLALLAPLAVVTPADTVYKWIEPDGSITFSSKPPPEGEAAESLEEVQVAAPPSEADRQNAERRRQAMQALAAEMERERKARAAAGRTPRVAPLPALPPAPMSKAAPGPVGEGLVYDDWWTGPARPAQPAPESAPAPAPAEEKKPFFTPGPVPTFH